MAGGLTQLWKEQNGQLCARGGGRETVKVFMCQLRPACVRKTHKRQEDCEHLTNSVQQCKHVKTARVVGEELNPISRTGNNFLITQQQESNLAK